MINVHLAGAFMLLVLAAAGCSAHGSARVNDGSASGSGSASGHGSSSGSGSVSGSGGTSGSGSVSK
jgi:hypothetical protein